MDAYGTMVALGFEYLVCSSFPHKMEILMNDINLFTMPALTREPSKQALWGAEGMEEDEEVDVAENSAQVSQTAGLSDSQGLLLLAVPAYR